jgi:hypothetical protein
MHPYRATGRGADLKLLACKSGELYAAFQFTPPMPQRRAIEGT